MNVVRKNASLNDQEVRQTDGIILRDVHLTSFFFQSWVQIQRTWQNSLESWDAMRVINESNLYRNGVRLLFWPRVVRAHGMTSCTRSTNLSSFKKNDVLESTLSQMIDNTASDCSSSDHNSRRFLYYFIGGWKRPFQYFQPESKSIKDNTLR